MADDEGFGGSGFGGSGFGGKKPTPKTTPAPTPAQTPAPSPVPAPTQNTSTTFDPYGSRQTVPAVAITDIPEEVLEALRKLKELLTPEQQALATISPQYSLFKGLDRCPPCHTFIPPKKDADEDDYGTCVYECEDDETCVDGVCMPPEKDDPLCKPTMRFEIDKDDRMCRVDTFNKVNANDRRQDDGFSFEIEGVPNLQYTYIVFDRTVSLNQVSGFREVNTTEEQSTMTQNYTAGSAQPRPRKFIGLSKGIGYRIPSPTFDCEPVVVMVSSANDQTKQPTNFKFHKDSADNLYLECLDLEVGERYDGTFIVQLQYPPLYENVYDKKTFMAETMTFNDLKAKAKANADFLPFMPPLDAEGIKSADAILTQKNYSADDPIKDVFEKVIGWLGKFSCEDIPKVSSSSLLPSELYMNTGAGACRHRAFMAFLIFNRLGLPTRYCTSTCHAWPEVWDYENRLWVQIDLGGCGDGDNRGCPPCHQKNPLYGTSEGEPACIPIECPENYYCDPQYNKCIPDCDTLFPDGEHHYNPRTGQCEKCDDGRVWNPILEVCECADCPDGFSMVDERCVDEEGNESEEAPLGFYTDLMTQLCYPIPDCSKDRPGTYFDKEQGQCLCPEGPNPLDAEAPNIPYFWNDEAGMCVPDYTKLCPPNQWWDEITQQCRPIPERLIPRPIIPYEDEPEVLEDVIIEEGRVREALTGWLNPKTGEMVDKTEAMRLGENEASLNQRGFTVKWEMMRVAKGGNTSMAISETLHGIADWIEKQDFLQGVNVVTGWSRSPSMNRLIYMQGTSNDADFSKWVESWESAIKNAYPSGRFSIQKSTDRMEVCDSLYSP